MGMHLDGAVEGVSHPFAPGDNNMTTSWRQNALFNRGGAQNMETDVNPNEMTDADQVHEGTRSGSTSLNLLGKRSASDSQTESTAPSSSLALIPVWGGGAAGPKPSVVANLVDRIEGERVLGNQQDNVNTPQKNLNRKKLRAKDGGAIDNSDGAKTQEISASSREGDVRTVGDL